MRNPTEVMAKSAISKLACINILFLMIVFAFSKNDFLSCLVGIRPADLALIFFSTLLLLMILLLIVHLMIFQNRQHRLRMKTKTMILMESLQPYRFMSIKITPKVRPKNSKDSQILQALIWLLGKNPNFLKILIMMGAPLLK